MVWQLILGLNPCLFCWSRAIEGAYFFYEAVPVPPRAVGEVLAVVVTLAVSYPIGVLVS